MKTATWRAGAALVLGAMVLTGAAAGPVHRAPWLNPKLPVRQRAIALVQRMSLREKVSQLVNGARAIARLGVPAYNWWSEGLHGAIGRGTTEFPEPMGLAATFDAAGIRAMAKAISIEGRIRYAEAAAHHHGTGMMHGLDFWAPNINICRDPRWGRCQETYGEDPFLTATLAVAYVRGMQGSNPRYYRAIATPKHFDAYSGPEPTRHFQDNDISSHDLEDTYLPAFRAAVVEGHAGSVMCAYVAVNGQPACANRFLLQKTLRGAWHFHGYVVSDCDAVHDIFTGHHYRSTQVRASAIAVERGMDNECADFGTPHGDADYLPFLRAVQEGYLSVHAVNRALVRLFTARIRLGLFDPPSMVPYDHINPDQLNSPAHRRLALRLAEESMVLLKNDGVLPLAPSVRRITVVGPLADQTAVMLGNYSGMPTHVVTVLEGLRRQFPHAKITYVPGTQFLSNGGAVVPAALFERSGGKPGLSVVYRIGAAHPHTVAGIAPRVDLDARHLPAGIAPATLTGASWSGYFTPERSGYYQVGVRTNGFASLTLGDEHLIESYSPGTDVGRVYLHKGRRVRVRMVYGHIGGVVPRAALIWERLNNRPDPAALAAARRADVVIAVVGLTSRLEGEQMPVHEPGFLGGDRTRLRLPRPEEALVREVARSGKPLIVVLMNGSALALPWEKRHAAAILEAWYGGEEGGAAIAATLSGRNDPSGRLPLTFYRSVHQLPNFLNYSMRGRTYRYFKGRPLWPFGYGLSYTTFSFSDLALPHPHIDAGQPLPVSVRVTNTGSRTGDEVVQLYLQFPPVPGAPLRALRGFTRVHLAPGQSRIVHFELMRRALSMVTERGRIIVAPGRYTLSVGGGQPGTGAPQVAGHFSVSGEVTLPD
ncbi:MAG: glycoside hydrolase family 3 C-terminal domain-containing protein [Steroidobacteraceae bacterium]